PRLQLRGSAGFTPASLAVQLVLNCNHARTQYWERAKNVSSKFNWRGSWKSIGPHVIPAQNRIAKRCRPDLRSASRAPRGSWWEEEESLRFYWPILSQIF